MSFVRRHRYYYKYGTELDATVVGSPTIDDGVVSGFTSSNYTRLPFTFEGGSYNNWELVTKIKVNSYSNGPAILCVNSSYGIFNYSVQSSGRVQLALSTSTDSFNICNDKGEKVLDLNTWYWYKAEFTGTAYNTYWSIDGKVWNLDSSVQNSTKLGSISALNFGVRTKNNDQILDGYIDMQETYFKANGVDVWHGTKVVESTEADADYHVDSNKLYNFTRRQRKYYKDGVEVPSSSITDFGRTAYYKNIVTTKYWKEITTGSRELAYAYYTGTAYGLSSHYYAKAPVGTDKTVYYSGDASYPVSSIDGIKVWSGSFNSVTEETAVIFGETINRHPDGDLYIDTTVTETVEGTPEDYTYTTEEVTTVEVTADDDYDYTEFVPSTQFDNYEDNNKFYQLTTKKRVYYKYEQQDWTQPINPSRITATSGWGNPRNAFDGSDGTYATCGTLTDYIEWDLGTDILLSGIVAYGQHVTNGPYANNITVKSVDSEGKETTLGTTTGTTTGNYTIRCTFSETKVNKLRFYLAKNDQGSNPSTSRAARIKEITLTANQQIVPVETTSSDYDYYEIKTKMY